MTPNYPACDGCGETSCEFCSGVTAYHFGRSWAGPCDLEENCPCPKAPCGLVIGSQVDESCSEHPIKRVKTIRSSHPASECLEEDDL